MAWCDAKADPAAAQKPPAKHDLVPGPLPKGAVPGCTGARDEVRLRVKVRNVADATGLMTVTLYPDVPRDFLARDGKIARLRVPAMVPETEVCLVAPRPGGYAIAVYHDENANRDYDRTAIGMPDEPFGFSNDVEPTLGLPKFRDVRFEAKRGDNPVTITLRHP